MRTLLIIVAAVLLSWTAIVSAATGTYKGESKADHGKLCHYDVHGSDRTIRIPSVAMCPLTREFPAAPAGSTNAVPPAATHAAEGHGSEGHT